VGFFAVPQMASPASSLSRTALKARDALVLQHLPLANAVAVAAARRLFPLVEREDLIQVAREALVRSAPRCRAGEPAEPYLRRCIQGALQHLSLDASCDGEPCLLDQLAAPDPSRLSAKPSMAWRWSSWLINCLRHRPQP